MWYHNPNKKSCFKTNGRCFHGDADCKSWDGGMDNTYLFREVREDFTEEITLELRSIYEVLGGLCGTKHFN